MNWMGGLLWEGRIKGNLSTTFPGNTCLTGMSHHSSVTSDMNELKPDCHPGQVSPVEDDVGGLYAIFKQSVSP